MTERQKCLGCDNPITFRWTDTHGVAVCCDCGLPYVLYHYEGKGDERKRVEKAPECPIFPEWIEVGRRYHKETKKLMFPSEFSFIGRGGRSYCGATEGDVLDWRSWIDAHKDELPKPRAEEAA